jgi:membrane protein implicated in regulation of membrane protease activity
MSDSVNLDIRYPIGGLFLILGALLVPYGLFASAAAQSRPNIDLWWGAVMLVFGALLLALARAARLRQTRTASISTHTGDS